MEPAASAAVVQRFIEAYNDRDIAAMQALAVEDVIFDRIGRERAIGRDALKWALSERIAQFEEKAGDVEIMVNSGGNRVAAEFSLRGIYRESVEGLPPATGQRFSLSAGLFAEVDEGRLQRVTIFYDPEILERQLSVG